MEGKLYVVATPIGNLEDITLRALRTLKDVDAIFCEDTRVTSKLLARYDISKPLVRCDDKSERDAATRALEMLEEGKCVALVSDAGTPGISDPGARLVRGVRDAGFSAIPIPGPSALTAALSIAALESDEFIFKGFLPHKKGRQTELKKIAEKECPVVLYESPHRIEKLMTELAAFAPGKHIALFREITKLYEEVLEGTAEELLRRLRSEKKARGEFVVVIR